MPVIFFVGCLCLGSWAQASPLIHRYLELVTSHSTEFAISKIEEAEAKALSEISLSAFDTTGFLGAELTQSDDPQTSPFSTSSTSRKTYTSGISKLWSAGVKTSLSYGLADTFLTFPGRPDLEFMAPDLSLTLETSLFKDLIQGRQRYLGQRVVKESERLSVAGKITRKQILVQSLLALAEVLEIRSELKLQESLCIQVNRQAQKLKKKYAQRSIAKKDYLLSQKDLNLCRGGIQQGKLKLQEKQELLGTQYGIPAGFFKTLQVDDFFADVETLYQAETQDASQADLSQREELVSLRQTLEVHKLKGMELAAEEAPEVKLAVTGGARGLGQRFSSAQQDVYDQQYSYVLASVRIEFPFSNRKAKTESLANNYKIMVLQKRLQNEELRIQSRFRILESGLKGNFSIYRDYQKNVALSESIFREARRDFSNGRIDFFALSEFQKALIISRRDLATLRSQILIQAVEYLDFFRFFDRYFQ